MNSNKDKLNYAYYLQNGTFMFGKPMYDIWGNGQMLCSNQSAENIKTWKARCKRQKLNVEITEIKTAYKFIPMPLSETKETEEIPF